MSSEVCPFCGKTYKRLKSHLPHCKAAASSKTPPTKHDVTVNQTATSSPQLAAAEPEAESTQTLSITASPQSKKSKKTSAVSSAALTQPSSTGSASLPTSTKKKKQKPSDQIKSANVSSSTAVPLASSPSLSLSPAISKPKKQSLRALIEAAKSKQVSKASLEGTATASEDQPSGSTPFVADRLRSRTTAETETETDPDKDVAHPAVLSTDTKPKAASTRKVSKAKKAAQSLSASKDTSNALDSKVNESRSSVREDFWADDEGEVEDLLVNKMFLKSGRGHKARITLQDVKATLRRDDAPRESSRPSILSQLETVEGLSSEIGPVPLPPGKDSCLVTNKTLSDQLSNSQHAEPLSVKRKGSERAYSVPLHQLELTSPAAPLLSGLLSSQASKATSPPHPVSANEAGVKATGLLALSPTLTKFSSPLPAARAETLRADDGAKSQFSVRKHNTTDDGSKGALTQRHLGQVRLGELPGWLAHKTPGHPKEVVEMVQRGWQWYNRKYIDVKKGGVGGVGMLLAGYCVLSYIWCYPHIKRDRWRKHH